MNKRISVTVTDGYEHLKILVSFLTLAKIMRDRISSFYRGILRKGSRNGLKSDERVEEEDNVSSVDEDIQDNDIGIQSSEGEMEEKPCSCRTSQPRAKWLHSAKKLIRKVKKPFKKEHKQFSTSLLASNEEIRHAESEELATVMPEDEEETKFLREEQRAEMEIKTKDQKVENKGEQIVQEREESKEVKEEGPEEDTQPIFRDMEIEKIDKVPKNEEIVVEFSAITREQFRDMIRHIDPSSLIWIDHKSLPTKVPGESRISSEWEYLPPQIIDKIIEMTSRNDMDPCPLSCCCRFSDDLIRMYHAVQLLVKSANQIDANPQQCKFRMSFSEVEFFKNDNNVCQAIISEMRGAYAEMYELMDMWREANEKLIVQEREFGIANSEVNDFKEDSSQSRTILHEVQRLEWNIDHTKNLLLDWQSSGEMERLRTEQRSVEQEVERQSENLYIERRNDCMNAVRKSLERKVRLEQENLKRNAVRAQQRQKDMLILLRSARLLQNYISDLRGRH